MVVSRIKNHKTTISTNANAGSCNPKKMIDQSVFKTNCTANNTRAPRFFCCHTTYSAIPIKKNNNVHTGANTQLGGVSTLRSTPTYHVSTDPAVKILPSIPASCGTSRQIINVYIFFILLKSIFILWKSPLPPRFLSFPETKDKYENNTNNSTE